MGERLLGVLFFYPKFEKTGSKSREIGRDNVREENIFVIRKHIPGRK